MPGPRWVTSCAEHLPLAPPDPLSTLLFALGGWPEWTTTGSHTSVVLNWGAILTPRGHLTASGYIFGCHGIYWDVAKHSVMRRTAHTPSPCIELPAHNDVARATAQERCAGRKAVSGILFLSLLPCIVIRSWLYPLPEGACSLQNGWLYLNLSSLSLGVLSTIPRGSSVLTSL